MSLRVAVSAAPVREQVVVNLRSAIAESLFEPGRRLVERELCDMLGVGRSSVREALRQLEAEGLVVIQPNKGPTVASFGPGQEKQISDIFETRAVLEGLMGRLFCQRASDAQVQKLCRIYDSLKERLAAKDYLGIFRIKTRYYDLIAAGCDNSIASSQQRILRFRLTVLRGRAMTSWWQYLAEESVGEVEWIIEAMLARDANEAERASIRNMEGAKRRALVVLAGEDEGAREP